MCGRLKAQHCIITAASAFVLYLLQRLCFFGRHDEAIKPLMIAFIGAAAALAAFKLFQKKLTAAGAVKYIIFAGIVMRIGYMLYTDCTFRSHDLGVADLTGTGHASYILTLIRTGSLPLSNEGQFYQQPLFYIIGSGVSRVLNGILGSDDAVGYVDAAKTVSCLASCFTLMLTDRLCDEIGLSGRGKAVAMSVTAFTPAFYLTARVTPDALAALFMVSALLMTVIWSKNTSWRNTLLLALIYGFGVMTKINVGSVAVITAGVFVMQAAKAMSEKRLLPFAARLAAFAGISLPLGLWYGVRNYLRFSQPLTYVPEFMNSMASVREFSLPNRFLYPRLQELSHLYANLYEDCNMPLYCLRTSVFGEFGYSVPTVLPAALLITAGLMAAVFAAAFISRLFKRKAGAGKRIIMASLAVYCTHMAVFYLRYPYPFSIDFRYLLFAAVAAAVIIGDFADSLHCKAGAVLISSLTAVYALLSMAMYVII